MYRFLIFALLLGGCASTGYEADDDDTAFHKAAVSWVGAPIQEMIERWGEPNNLHVEASAERDGLARWRTTGSRPGVTSSAAIGGGAGHYTCIAEARYDLNGMITKVDTVSTHCDKAFDDERIAKLTR